MSEDKNKTNEKAKKDKKSVDDKNATWDIDAELDRLKDKSWWDKA